MKKMNLRLCRRPVAKRFIRRVKTAGRMASSAAVPTAGLALALSALDGQPLQEATVLCFLAFGLTLAKHALDAALRRLAT